MPETADLRELRTAANRVIDQLLARLDHSDLTEAAKLHLRDADPSPRRVRLLAIGELIRRLDEHRLAHKSGDDGTDVDEARIRRALQVLAFLESEIAAGNEIAVIEPGDTVRKVELLPEKP